MPRNERVLWYNCGPTVYDVSHMGHARCYISFDILRRVLQHYFDYPVHFVQNVTDVDDKIIKRARQDHLWTEFFAGVRLTGVDPAFERLLEEAVQLFQARVAREDEPAKRAMLEKQLAAAQSHHATVDQVEEHCRPVLVELLDLRLGAHVTDKSMFTRLPREFEADFYADMDRLNILRPDETPRVSEYVPQIIAFTAQIMQNGFAYESNGSVYFDTLAFNASKKHRYGKLAPEAIGNMCALNEGEGDLSVSDEKQREKRSQNDFALWKRSKGGEPFWESPWGIGRPGKKLGPAFII